MVYIFMYEKKKGQVHDIWRWALINYDQFSKEHFTELFMVSHTICIQVKCKRSDHCYMRIPTLPQKRKKKQPIHIQRKMLVTFNFSQWIHICFAVFSLLPFLLWHVENDINTNFSLVTLLLICFHFDLEEGLCDVWHTYTTHYYPWTEHSFPIDFYHRSWYTYLDI